jgi:hypothetical protein
LSDFLQTITAPLDGDNPFGSDVNHDPDYERLKDEMGKLGDIDANVVEALSFKILSQKSKDARALAFLAYAVLRRGDFGKLADVFCALADYCGGGFGQIFPQREGAKLAALRWLSEPRFAGQCEKAAPSAQDAPHIARLEEAVLKLRAALDSKFSDSAPPLSPLYKRVLGWKKAAETALLDKDVSDNGNLVGAPLADARNDGNNKSAGTINHPQIDNVDKLPEKIIIELTRNEYLQVNQCIKRLEELMGRFV